MNTPAKRPAEGLAPRRAAAENLAAVLAGDALSPLTEADMADPRDRAFANRLTTTALRRHGHLNAIVLELMPRGLPKRAGRFEPILRLGLTELLFLPGAEPHAALFMAGEALKADRRGSHLLKLLNGVLRAAQRRADEFANLDPRLLFPGWLREKWLSIYGEPALSAFARALIETPPLDLSLKTEDADCIEALAGVETLPGSLRLFERDRPVSQLPGYASGDWWVQDVAATLAARLMPPQPGARVLDMCAAPGGKTAQLCASGYAVTAIDEDATRMARLETNLTRIGYESETIIADGTVYAAPTPFDAILLDAPCSATGTFRRHPELLWHRRPGDIAGRVRLQRRLAENAVRNLAPGGTFVFCTCSLEPQEGEDQADWLETGPLGLVPAPIDLDEIGGFADAVTARGHIRTHPGQSVPGADAGHLDGFFIARFRRPS